MTLNSFRSNKMWQKLIYSILFACLQNFQIFTFFLLLEFFLDEPAMVLRYFIACSCGCLLAVWRVVDGSPLDLDGNGGLGFVRAKP
jgi:hypothetical protein